MVLRPNSRENMQLLALWLRMARVEIDVGGGKWSELGNGTGTSWLKYIERKLKTNEPLLDADRERQFRFAH